MRRSVTPKQVSALQKPCGLDKKRVRRCTQRDRRSCKQDFPDPRNKDLESGTWNVPHRSQNERIAQDLDEDAQNRCPVSNLSSYLKQCRSLILIGTRSK